MSENVWKLGQINTLFHTQTSLYKQQFMQLPATAQR